MVSRIVWTEQFNFLRAIIPQIMARNARQSPSRREFFHAPPFVWFLIANVLLCGFVFRGGLWGKDLLAPIDILPVVATKYHFVDPHSSGVPANQFIMDQVTFDLPLQTAIYRSYRSGEIPWWDPYTYSGRPLLADAHINGTEPIRVLAYLTLPFELAYNWTRVLNFVFGGLSMLWLLRHWRFSATVSVMLALAYEFAGGFVLYFGHPWIQAQFNYYPLIWLAWDAWFRERPWWSIPLATLAVAGVFNAGNLQSHAYLVLFAGAILLGYGGKTLPEWKRIAPVVVSSGILGLALASPVLLGEIELFLHRTRHITVDADPAAIGGLGTIATFYPWAMGTFRTLDLGKLFGTSNMGFNLFVGPAAVLAALLGGLQGGARGELSAVRRVALWLVLIYLVVVCTPLVGVLYQRSAGLGVLGVVVLAALGMETLFAAAEPMRHWGRWILGLLTVTVIATHVGSLVIYPRFIPTIRQLVAERVRRSSTGLEEASALREFQITNFGREVSFRNPETIWACLGIVLFAGVCLYPAVRKKKWALPTLLALNLLPPVMFAQRFVPVQPIGLWRRLMAEGTEPRRVAGVLNGGHLRLMEVSPKEFERLYPKAMAVFFQVHSLDGYAGLQPPSFNLLAPAELDRYLPEAADYTYESTVPRAPVGELRKNPTPGLARFQWAEGINRDIHIEKESMNSIELGLGGGPEATLVRTDTYYPGWSASIGGTKLTIGRARPFFSRIHIPPGPQTLTLRYSPTYLRRGIALACIAFCVTCVITFFAARPPERKPLVN
jgi:hypothetical protein